MLTYKQISYNVTAMKRTKADIKYIVVHDTGNTRSGANAEMHYKYFSSMDRNSSADIFVDDKEVIKINDYYKFFCWHVGDGRGQYGITNSNSIGIELCINADGNYSKMLESAVIIVRELMKELGVPAERVVRHWDASRKNCPGTFAANDWARWKHFKNRISGSGEEQSVMEPNSKLQSDLNVLGYRLVVDGIIGPKTIEAVRDFQSFFTLKVDGLAGPITKGKLIDVMGRKNNRRPPF